MDKPWPTELRLDKAGPVAAILGAAGHHPQVLGVQAVGLAVVECDGQLLAGLVQAQLGGPGLVHRARPFLRYRLAAT